MRLENEKSAATQRLGWLRWLGVGLVFALIASFAAAPAFAERCDKRDRVFMGMYSYGVEPRGPEASTPQIDGDRAKQLADIILGDPETAKQWIRGEFRQHVKTNRGKAYREAVHPPSLLAHLAVWVMDEQPNGKDLARATKAYKRARDMVMEVYDEAHLSDDGLYQDRLIASTVNLHGVAKRHEDMGTAAVKADWLAYLGDRVRRAEKQKKRAIASQAAKHINWLLFGCESGSVLQYVVFRDKRDSYGGELEVELDRILAAPLVYRSSYAEAALAQALARLSVQVAKSAKRAMEKDNSKNSRVAYDRAWLLGQVLAHLDVALWKHVRAARKDKATIEHGAKIVRSSLKAVDYLTAGLSKPGTKALRQGVDWLEKREKAAEAAAEKASFSKVRTKLVETAVIAFQSEVGDPQMLAMNKPELIHWIRQFRDNVMKGHDETMRAKFSGVKLPGSLNLAAY